MPTLEVRVPGTSEGPSHPRVTITVGNLSLTLPITSPRSEHDRLAADWVEIPRPGQRPLLRNAGGQLRRMTIDVIFKNYRVGGGPVERDLLALAKLSRRGKPLRVSYGPFEAGLWRLTDITIRSTKRALKTNHIKLAEVRLQFTEAFEETRKPTAAQRPAETEAPGPPAAGAGGKPSPKTQTHVVKKGETLSRIALDHCGNANLWPKIATANKIRNPNRIFPGQKLTIPC